MVTFSSDSKYLAISGEAGVLRGYSCIKIFEIHDDINFREIQTLDTNGSDSNFLIFSSDNFYLVAGSFKSIIVWENTIEKLSQEPKIVPEANSPKNVPPKQEQTNCIIQ